MQKKLKVLLSVFSCAPGEGSELGVGWEVVKQVSKCHEVWVLTWTESAAEKRLMDNVHWHLYELPRMKRIWDRGAVGASLYYYLWQLAIFQKAKQLHKTIGFDLIHHVTLGKYWAPSFLCLLRVPFIWGPVGGAESVPQSLFGTLNARGRAFEALRAVGRAVEEADPFVRLTAKRATIGLAKTDQTATRLRRLGCREVRVLSEVSLSADQYQALRRSDCGHGGGFRILNVARLVQWKGIHLGLSAFARLIRHFPNSTYTIVGSGPERANLQRLALDLGVANQVLFLGTLSRADMVAELGRCDCLIHPTLHDSGGWVSVEAMAAGKPVICLDCGGPAFQVTNDTGFKITTGDPESTIEKLKSAMELLAEDPQLRERLGSNGRRLVVEKFLSDRRASLIADLYDEALSLGLVQDHVSTAAISKVRS